MKTYTTQEVTSLLHVNRKTLQMLREEGALEAVKARTYVYSEQAINDFLAKFAGHSISNREEVKRVMSHA